MSLGDLATSNIDLILKAIDVNYKPLQTQHEIMRQKLERAKEIHITTPAGTDLYYNKSGIKAIAADGNITEIKGNEEAKQLEATLKWAASVAKNPGNVRRICELGIGLNSNASIIGAMIVDDKTLGTAHIGIGSNYWFGGNIYAIIHLDQVFKNPKIYLDGELLKI